MRIFLVYPGHGVSTIDVARGYEAALRELGHDVRSYDYHNSLAFYGEAMEYWRERNPAFTGSQEMWLQASSEQAVIEAVRYVPDLVIIVCGMVLHRSAFDLLGRNLGLPLVLILTESPYLDKQQAEIIRQGHIKLVFTNERRSAYYLSLTGVPTTYLPHSYDPARHRPIAVNGNYQSDVFFCGTLYQERTTLFDAVDWAGIDWRLLGQESAEDGVSDKLIPNDEVVRYYNGTKIALTMHRTSIGLYDDRLLHIEDGAAWSIGPRSYEIAGCGAFQISDDSRGELWEVFGDTIPTFRTPEQLERLMRQYLADDATRHELARAQRERVKPCSFINRARDILVPTIEEVL